MKISLPVCLALLLAFASCNKKDKTSPEPVEEEIKVTELTDKDFIQYIEVPGSEKIVFDSTLKAYLVTLPAGYATDRINVNFKFYPGAFLTSGHSAESAQIIDFTFRNRAPLFFQVSSAKEKLENYQVYIKHNGQLKGSMFTTENLQCDPDANFNIPVEITSGLGTIPETPDSKLNVTAFLRDDKTNQELQGVFFQSSLYFQNVSPFLKSDGVSLSIKYGDRTLTLIQNKKLSQMKAIAYQMSGYPLLRAIPANQEFTISGNGFTSKNKYTLKIGNEFSEKSFLTDASFTETSRLSGSLPGTLPNGSYSVDIFQNDSLINSIVHTISTNENEKSISQMWTRQNDYPTGDRNYFLAKKLSLEKGQSLFANPLPGIMGGMYQGFDYAKAIPDLELKGASQTVTIKAAVKSDGSFADGSIRLYYGEYATPANLSSGFYEARLIYADKSVSLPFWSKIEIK